MIEHDILDKLPDSFDYKTIEAISAITERHIFGMFAVLRSEFGRVPTKMMDQKMVCGVMEQLAVDIADEVDGVLSIRRYRETQQASANLLQGVLSGIELGRREKP